MFIRPYHWEELDYNDKMQIRVWGYSPESEPILLRVENYPATMLIELPRTVIKNGSKCQMKRWGCDSVRTIHKFITKKIARNQDESFYPLPFSKRDLVSLKKLYYFTPRRTTFVTLRFKTIEASKNAYYTLRDKTIYVGDNFKFSVSLSIYESNFGNTKINNVRKLQSLLDVKVCDWIEFEGEYVDPHESISTLREYIAPYQSLKQSEIDYGVPNVSLISFDIEVYSDNHDKFPSAKNPCDYSYMISAVYHVLGTEEYKRYCVLYGDCIPVQEYLDKYGDERSEKFRNTELILVDSETEMVNAFGDIIVRHDPTILTGYNIFGFDIPYLDTRIDLEANIVNNEDSWPQMSRIKGAVTKTSSIRWSSNAYGSSNMLDIILPGRISLDMIKVVQREQFNYNSYTLNNVSKELLGDTKFDVKPKEMFEAFADMKEVVFSKKVDRNSEQGIKALSRMTEVILYCIQDSELPIDIMKKLNTWIAYLENASIMGINIYDLSTRGQQIRSVSQIYHMAYKLGYAFTIRGTQPDIPFQGGFVNEPSPGLWDNVPVIDFKSLYPTIIAAFNICYTTYIDESNWRLVEREMFIVEVVDEDGNTIRRPLTKDDVYEVSIECQEKIDPEQTAEIIASGLSEEEIDEKSIYKAQGTAGTYVFRFVKKHILLGVLPQVVYNLLSERTRIRSLIPGEKDPLKKTILDKRQLSLKVSTNSLYGLLGVRNNGKLPFIEAATCTTYYGRNMIEGVNKYIRKAYGGHIVYGDTDSTMFQMSLSVRETFPVKDYERLACLSEEFHFVREVIPYYDCEFCKYHTYLETCSCKRGQSSDMDETSECLCWKHRTDKDINVYWGYRISEEVTLMFPEPVEMEYEKDFSIFLSILKKKYIGVYSGQEGIPIEERKKEIKGVMLARRDNCEISRHIYNNIINMCLSRTDFLEVVRYLENEINSVAEGHKDWEDFIITRRMGYNYKQNTNFHMKVFGEKMRRLGRPIEPGEMSKYLVVKMADEYRHQTNKDGRVFRRLNKKYLLGDKQITRDMYEMQSEKYQIDYNYYVSRQIRSHVDQVVGITYNNLCDHITVAFHIQPTPSHSPKTIHEIVKMFTFIRDFDIRINLSQFLTDNPWIEDFNNGIVYKQVLPEDLLYH